MFEITTVRRPLLTLLLLGIVYTYAQTGPGGVSENNLNQFWFDANDLILNDGQRVEYWYNKGGNSENFYQKKYARRPIFKSSTPFLNNGFPSIQFDGMDDVLKLKNTTVLNLTSSPVENRSYSFVIKTGNDVLNRQCIYDEGGNKRGLNIYIYNDSLYIGGWNLKAADGPDAPWGFAFAKTKIVSNTQYIVSFVFKGNDTKTGTIDCFLNNQLFGTITDIGRLYTHDVGAGLGNIKGKTRFESPFDVYNGNKGFSGTLSEWIYFDYAISKAERMVVENYLAGKYDIPLSTNLYTQRNFHQHDIIGIGMADDGTSHIESRGRNILSISSPSELNNGDFLFMGHDNGSLEFSKECPDNTSQRLERVWRVTEISEVGTMTVKFDLTGLTNLPTNPNEFMLLVDNDGDFTNASVRKYGTSIVNNEIIFDDVNLDWSEFVTLGTWKTITWDNLGYHNGSGTNEAPGLGDGNRKFLVTDLGAEFFEDGEVLCMRVNALSDITITHNVTLSVKTTIENHGEIHVLEDASLVQSHSGIDKNTGVGEYFFTRTGLQNSNGYNAWSSPMKNTHIMTSFASSNQCDIFFFDANKQRWLHDFPLGSSANCNGTNVTFTNGNLIAGADGYFNPGFGYFIPGSPDADSTRNFKGIANNGILSVPIYQRINPTNVNWTGDDWNLIGNPYLSAINAEKFWQENAINNPKIIGAIYYWDDDDSGGSGYNENDDYASWNLLGGTAASSGKIPNGFVSSGQAFWVISNMDTDIIFNNEMRGGNNTQFYKNESNPLNASRMWLSIETPTTNFNQILVGFSDSATTGYDSEVDAFKIEGNPKILFGSKVQGQTDPFIIQGQSFLKPYETRTIPLYVKTQDPGIHHFNLDKMEDFGTNYIFYLKDKKTNKLHNIKNGPLAAYMDTGLHANRFELIIKNILDTDAGGQNSGGVTTSVDNIEKENTIVIQQDHSNISVHYDLSSKATMLTLTNLNGSTLKQVKVSNKAGTASINSSQLPAGVYIVSLSTNDFQHVQKIIVQ